MIYLGMSSGKYHKYLFYKKPVLISEGLVGVSEFTVKHGFGEQAGVSNVACKLDKIVANYSRYVENIERHYASLCSYEKPYNEFVDSFLKKGVRDVYKQP